MSRRVYGFVDAANVWQVQKTKGKMLDLEKLQRYLTQRYKASELRMYYYDAYPAQSTRSYSLDGKFKFYTMLEKKLGIIVRKKPLKQIHSLDSRHADGMIEKGNMDVELAIDAVHLADRYDTALLFTGDSDFLGLVKFLRARGKKVYTFSTRNNVSNELRTAGDGYVDILGIQDDLWGREIRFREQKSN